MPQEPNKELNNLIKNAEVNTRIMELMDGELVDTNNRGTLEIWAIYKNPSDYPDKFVARKFILDKPTKEIIIADSIEELRARFKHLIRLERDEFDDPVIEEIWL